MVTNRTPINRTKSNVITPRVVEQYRRAREIEAARATERWEDQGGRRREYLDVSVELDSALGTKLWEESILYAAKDDPIRAALDAAISRS